MKKLLLSALVALVLFASVKAAHAQTVSVLYNFGAQNGDATQQFYSGIIAQGSDGNLYSSSSDGGAFNIWGANYKVTPAGAFTTIFSFSADSNGLYPTGGLTLGTDGNFYGTTGGGGFYSFGTVFKMTPAGGLTTLYTFTDGTDGSLPYAPPVEGPDGNYYGGTCPGCNGTSASSSIYKITPSGTFTVIHDCNGTDCYDIEGPLVLGTDGNFYGTSQFGGSSGSGTVFKITTSGKLTVLHTFDGADGSLPACPLVQGKDGNFYGTTIGGGTNNLGTVFKITSTGKFTSLYSMDNAVKFDGESPFAGLVQATDGNFYGANSGGGVNGDGTLFKITSAGKFTKFYDFDGTTGETPYSTMVQHTNGVLYGGTQLGGTGDVDIICSAGDCGVIYSVNIGAAPFAALVTSSGKVGVKIGILGQNFSKTSVVTFGSAPATTVAVTGTTFLTATVPSGATTGSVTVTTTSGTLTSSKTFRVTPQITSFSPTSGAVGTVVTITGVSLSQTSKVTFGGVSATFTVNSDSSVSATVPTGAKSGKIVITTPGGTATSSGSFTVT